MVRAVTKAKVALKGVMFKQVEPGLSVLNQFDYMYRIVPPIGQSTFIASREGGAHRVLYCFCISVLADPDRLIGWVVRR